jgi:Domain of unknown function, DUF529
MQDLVYKGNKSIEVTKVMYGSMEVWKYGNIYLPLRLVKTFSKQLKITQIKTDPCIFYDYNEKKNNSPLPALYREV